MEGRTPLLRGWMIVYEGLFASRWPNEGRKTKHCRKSVAPKKRSNNVKMGRYRSWRRCAHRSQRVSQRAVAVGARGRGEGGGQWAMGSMGEAGREGGVRRPTFDRTAVPGRDLADGERGRARNGAHRTGCGPMGLNDGDSVTRQRNCIRGVLYAWAKPEQWRALIH